MNGTPNWVVFLATPNLLPLLPREELETRNTGPEGILVNSLGFLWVLISTTELLRKSSSQHSM